jgi:hypothetical protein
MREVRKLCTRHARSELQRTMQEEMSVRAGLEVLVPVGHARHGELPAAMKRRASQRSRWREGLETEESPYSRSCRSHRHRRWQRFRPDQCSLSGHSNTRVSQSELDMSKRSIPTGFGDADGGSDAGLRVGGARLACRGAHRTLGSIARDESNVKPTPNASEDNETRTCLVSVCAAWLARVAGSARPSRLASARRD